MAFFDSLFKRKKETVPLENDVSASVGELEDNTAPDWDFQYSQSVFDRNLAGVTTFEIEPASLDDTAKRNELYFGEFIEMTEGRMVLGVRVRSSCGRLFDSSNEVSLSYSKYGESFFIEATVIKTTGTDTESEGAPLTGNSNTSEKDNVDTVNIGWEFFIIEIILCSEPIRHRRKYGRVAIEWNVYYTVHENGLDKAAVGDDSSSYSVTKTIDISEGGFKSIVEKQLAADTIISCIVEVDNHSKSQGTLTGKILRCDPMMDSIEMFEMTVQFIDIDDHVQAFLVDCIEKKHPGAVDAEAKISVSSDGLEAIIEISPPRNNGSDLSYEALCARLAIEGVTFGVDSDTIMSLADKPYYNLETVIARGIPPIHGDDAELTYYVDMNPVLAPKEYEDGTVDFKDIGLIRQVSKGDVLVEKTSLTAGTAGTCVTGGVYEAAPGKDKRLPAGENTVSNEDGTALYADIDGCISIVDEKINIFSTYVVEGDVQYETGNIDHNGIVVVKGDVRYGFAVHASGDIIIHGTVESAAITAGGSLVVQGGCVG